MKLTDWTGGAPGSDEARKGGCTCPIIDNKHGRGYFGNGERYGWVINGDCPLHGIPAATATDAGKGERNE